MHETVYLIGVLGVVFVMTFALRALPFAVLEPLRESRFVGQMAVWMPVGILGILAASTFVGGTKGLEAGLLWKGALAAVVTIAVHVLLGRRTLLSVGAGTVTYVALVNL